LLLRLFCLEQLVVVGTLAKHFRAAPGASFILAGNTLLMGEGFAAFGASTTPAGSHFVSAF
jgi:hypothetical protein